MAKSNKTQILRKAEGGDTVGRLIDADALIEAINEMPVLCRDPGWVKAAVLLTIDKMPTIDAIPVEWLTQRLNETASGEGMNVEINHAIITVLAERESRVGEGET